MIVLTSDFWRAAFTAAQHYADIDVSGIVINRAGVTIAIIVKSQNFQQADFWHSKFCWGMGFSDAGLALFG